MIRILAVSLSNFIVKPNTAPQVPGLLVNNVWDTRRKYMFRKLRWLALRSWPLSVVLVKLEIRLLPSYNLNISYHVMFCTRQCIYRVWRDARVMFWSFSVSLSSFLIPPFHCSPLFLHIPNYLSFSFTYFIPVSTTYNIKHDHYLCETGLFA